MTRRRTGRRRRAWRAFRLVSFLIALPVVVLLIVHVSRIYAEFLPAGP